MSRNGNEGGLVASQVFLFSKDDLRGHGERKKKMMLTEEEVERQF